VAKLTSRQRQRLPASQFGLPELEEFPVCDARHANAAMSRLFQRKVARNLTREQWHRAYARILAAQLRFKAGARAACGKR
jgi:hypothetical protein